MANRFVLTISRRSQTSKEESWIVARSLEDAEVEAKQRAGGRAYTLDQDDDVLDTWFSAGLWPFAAMGWPQKVSDKRDVLKRCTDIWP
jgi:valyl-tRNA synthetase